MRHCRTLFGRCDQDAASIERTSSMAPRKGTSTVCTESVRAAGSIAAIYFRAVGAISGLNMIATLATLGAASLSSANHLPPIVRSELLQTRIIGYRNCRGCVRWYCGCFATRQPFRVRAGFTAENLSRACQARHQERAGERVLCDVDPVDARSEVLGALPLEARSKVDHQRGPDDDNDDGQRHRDQHGQKHGGDVRLLVDLGFQVGEALLGVGT
jgi:hypothetical protein